MGRPADGLSGSPGTARQSGPEPVGIFGGSLGRRYAGYRDLRPPRQRNELAGRAQRSTAAGRALYTRKRRSDVAAYRDDGGPLEFAGAAGRQKDLALGAGRENHDVRERALQRNQQK